MAKFQCLVSGNFVEFKDENDIKDMLIHPQYKLWEEPVKVKESITKVINKAKE